MIFYEASSATAPDNLRLDISAVSSGFDKGDFGMVRLRDVARIEPVLDTGIDLEASRIRFPPILLKTVRSNTVVIRSSALPTALDLRSRTPFQSNIAIPQLQLDALVQDLETGSLGQFLVLYKTSFERRSIRYNALVGEGMQPGLTYSIRLVSDASNIATTLDEDVCRAPVCPADFVDSK
jgi:hypothetical protein